MMNEVLTEIYLSGAVKVNYGNDFNLQVQQCLGYSKLWHRPVDDSERPAEHPEVL